MTLIRRVLIRLGKGLLMLIVFRRNQRLYFSVHDHFTIIFIRIVRYWQ